MDPDRYPTEIFWSEEDGGYIALARDLPGCSAFGSTKEEAVRELRDAIHAWIEAAKKAGNPVPEPSQQPEFSGKLLLRMPKTLHAQLAKRASLEGVSLNQYVVYLLSQGQATNVQAGQVLQGKTHIFNVYGAPSPCIVATSSRQVSLENWHLLELKSPIPMSFGGYNG